MRASNGSSSTNETPEGRVSYQGEDGMAVQVGDLAPNFTLSDQSGTPISLEHFLGKEQIVLYFYPRDNTAMRTEEACAFRDSYSVFQHVGAKVIGISSDSVEEHQRFAKEHQLPFSLLSDVGSVIRRLYGVPTSFGLPGRVTYVIDRQGIVRHVFFSQYTSHRHVYKALLALQSMQEYFSLEDSHSKRNYYGCRGISNILSRAFQIDLSLCL